MIHPNYIARFRACDRLSRRMARMIRRFERRHGIAVGGVIVENVTPPKPYSITITINVNQEPT